jgi:hypothetical protein
MFLYFLLEVVVPPSEVTTVEPIVCEEFDDGWLSYSDPDVTMH